MRQSHKLISTLVLAALTAFTGAAQETDTTDTAETQSAASTLGFRQVFGEELMASFLSRTMDGVYRDYEINMRAGIAPTTYTEFHHPNAVADYQQKGPISFHIKGVYTVKKDQICYAYDSPGKVVGNFCFYIFKQDSCYYQYYEPYGLPVTAEDFDQWSSMAYAVEDAGTCLPSIS